MLVSIRISPNIHLFIIIIIISFKQQAQWQSDSVQKPHKPIAKAQEGCAQH